jgi:hypothetical protein
MVNEVTGPKKDAQSNLEHYTTWNFVTYENRVTYC